MKYVWGKCNYFTRASPEQLLYKHVYKCNEYFFSKTTGKHEICSYTHLNLRAIVITTRVSIQDDSTTIRFSSPLPPVKPARTGTCRSMFWTYPGICISMFWTYPRICRSMFWTYPGVCISMFWTYSGICISMFWTYPGIFIRMFWTCPWICRSMFWTYPGICISMFWTYLGICISMFWTYSGICISMFGPIQEYL